MVFLSCFSKNAWTLCFFLVVECLSFFYGLLCSALSIKSPSKVKFLPAGYKVRVCWGPSQSMQLDAVETLPCAHISYTLKLSPPLCHFCSVDGWECSPRSRASAVSPLKMSFNATKNVKQSPAESSERQDSRLTTGPGAAGGLVAKAF